MYKASYVSFEKQNIFNVKFWSRCCDKKSHIEPKYMKIIIELGKYRKTKTLMNNTL